MPKSYTVSDGELVLTLEEAEEGGYVVTSPMDPELVTEAETIPEAFDMARDAMETLMASRRKPLCGAGGGEAEGQAQGTPQAEAENEKALTDWEEEKWLDR